ncbi:hypothetical protein QTP86_006127 [Hemibagrus guttatus]|nr:hypothetical protein QTP86_006127 [Hemibagrus guttatus]
MFREAATKNKTTDLEEYTLSVTSHISKCINDRLQVHHYTTQSEAVDDREARKTIPLPEDQVLCLTTANVKKTLHRVNPWKAAGPDNIPGRVLRKCAEELADVFNDVFSISLNNATIPTTIPLHSHPSS